MVHPPGRCPGGLLRALPGPFRRGVPLFHENIIRRQSARRISRCGINAGHGGRRFSRPPEKKKTGIAAPAVSQFRFSSLNGGLISPGKYARGVKRRPPQHPGRPGLLRISSRLSPTRRRLPPPWEAIPPRPRHAASFTAAPFSSMPLFFP